MNTHSFNNPFVNLTKLAMVLGTATLISACDPENPEDKASPPLEFQLTAGNVSTPRNELGEAIQVQFTINPGTAYEVSVNGDLESLTSRSGNSYVTETFTFIADSAGDYDIEVSANGESITFETITSTATSCISNSAFFSNRIQPKFTALSCADSGCHGGSAPNIGVSASTYSSWENIVGNKGSNLYLKPSGSVSHGGGSRFNVFSEDFRDMFEVVESRFDGFNCG